MFVVITLTSSAENMLQKVMQDKGLSQHALRVFVAGGGCSGLSYGMTFAQGPEVGDEVFQSGGVTLVVDPGSIQYLDGAEIDYVDSLMGGGFRIENPNAVRTCSCGSSFQSAAGEKGSSCCSN